MLQLCIDARLYNASGIGTFLKAALTFLTSLSSYKLILLCRKEDRPLLERWSDATIVMKSPIYTVQEQIEYPQIIPRCDLFWSPHFNVPLLPIRAKKRLVTVHDVYHLAHFSTLSLQEKIYAKGVYQAAFSLSDRVTTISHFSKSEILKWAWRKPKTIDLVTPGLDHFNPTETVEKEKKHLLFVGNLKPHKNLIRLLQAYERVHPEEPLVIVGQGNGSLLTQEIEKSVFLGEKVRLAGYVGDEELKNLYAKAKLFLFPSLYEGFGYPPLEAMAFGCPVLASQAAAIPEVCEDAVEYIDPFSVDAIAEGMKRLLGDWARRQELIEKGKALFAKKKGQKNNIGEVIDACCCGA